MGLDLYETLYRARLVVVRWVCTKGPQSFFWVYHLVNSGSQPRIFLPIVSRVALSTPEAQHAVVLKSSQALIFSGEMIVGYHAVTMDYPSLVKSLSLQKPFPSSECTNLHSGSVERSGVLLVTFKVPFPGLKRLQFPGWCSHRHLLAFHHLEPRAQQLIFSLQLLNSIAI